MSISVLIKTNKIGKNKTIHLSSTAPTLTTPLKHQNPPDCHFNARLYQDSASVIEARRDYPAETQRDARRRHVCLEISDPS